MPRALSDDTQFVLWWLWRLPWACAADIARVTGLKQNAIGNILKRRKKQGWLESARLGRVFAAVDRYVFSTKGAEEMSSRYGWPIFWWHTADGVRALARRLEVVETAYRHLPFLWQSNLVTVPRCWVYHEWEDIAWQTGRPVTRAELVEADWSYGWLRDLHWLQSGPFEAIATYSDGVDDTARLHLPVLWRTDFQKPSDIDDVRRDMSRLLEMDERWSKLPMNQAVSSNHVPGLVIFCPGRVAAAMAQRHWRESIVSIDHGTTPAIIDAEGQVVRAMSPPTARWQGFRLPPAGGPLKDVSRIVERLKAGSYAAVNGKQSWRTFRAIDGSPGVRLDHVADSVKVGTTVARDLLQPMVDNEVISVRAGGHYLEAPGRGLLAYSQRVTAARTKKRWGVYTTRGGEYRRAQRLHNQGQAQALLYLRRHGYPAFPAMGLVIDYWHQGRRIRVVPDGFVVLPPGVLAAVEFERSAKTPKEVEKKAQKYGSLDLARRPIPVLFIMETLDAVQNLARLRYPYILATTLDSVREGPHGSAVIRDGKVSGEPGCWWYWYGDLDAPSPDVPIDMWSHIYVESGNNRVWRLPLDNPFRQRKYS